MQGWGLVFNGGREMGFERMDIVVMVMGCGWRFNGEVVGEREVLGFM